MFPETLPEPVASAVRSATLGTDSHLPDACASPPADAAVPSACPAISAGDEDSRCAADADSRGGRSAAWEMSVIERLIESDPRLAPVGPSREQVAAVVL